MGKQRLVTIDADAEPMRRKQQRRAERETQQPRTEVAARDSREPRDLEVHPQERKENADI